jgi:hypothetical protein
MCVLCPKSSSFEEFKMDASDIDIFQHTANGNTLFKNWIIRFDPSIYKINHEVDDKFGSGTDGLKLIRTITKMLIDTGQGIFVSNGAKSKKNRFTECEICCSRQKLYRNRNTATDDNATSRLDIQLRRVSCKAYCID